LRVAAGLFHQPEHGIGQGTRISAVNSNVQSLKSKVQNGTESAALVRMSLNQLLNFVPLVRRLVPQQRDSGDQATSGAFMVFLSLNLLAAVWGLMLLVSAVALIMFAVLTPGVAFFSSPDARDAEIQSIKSVTDAGLLQRKAVFDVSQGSASSATATYLCHIAVDTLLLMMIGSFAGLLLIRWIKRHLGTVADDTPPGPARATIELLNRLKRTEGESES